MILGYLLLFILDEELVCNLGEEDAIIEWSSAIFLLVASVVLLATFIKTRNLFFILLSFIFFFGFGEEISWGQRLFNYETPAKIKELNVQKEFNLHNMEIFNYQHHNGEAKKGVSKIFVITYLFLAYNVIYGVVFPFLIFSFKFLRSINKIIRIPVPPISIGMCFVINLLIFEILLHIILIGREELFYNSISEFFELITAFILLNISIYFYKKREIAKKGIDIKETFI